MRKALQSDDKEDGGNEICQIYNFPAHDGLFSLLNFDNMRWVTRKPPTTLMVAKIKALIPRTTERVELPAPAERRAPINVIPDMALEPDMRGVWRMGGTLVITSKPTNTASTNTVTIPIKLTAVVPPAEDFLYC
jgi:hypothetical protein